MGHRASESGRSRRGAQRAVLTGPAAGGSGDGVVGLVGTFFSSCVALSRRQRREMGQRGSESDGEQIREKCDTSTLFSDESAKDLFAHSSLTKVLLLVLTWTCPD